MKKKNNKISGDLTTKFGIAVAKHLYEDLVIPGEDAGPKFNPFTFDIERHAETMLFTSVPNPTAEQIDKARKAARERWNFLISQDQMIVFAKLFARMEKRIRELEDEIENVIHSMDSNSHQ